MNRASHQTTLAVTQAMLTCMACVAYGQVDTARHRGLEIGGAASVAPSVASATMVLPGFSAECGTLADGTGFQYAGGALVEFPFGDVFRLQVRPAITFATMRLQDPIPVELPIARDDGNVVNASVDQRLDIRRLDLGAALLMRYALAGPFSLLGGLSLRHVLSIDATHSQVAIAPDELLLSNNRRELTLGEGNLIQSAPLIAALNVGGGVDLPLSATSWLSPEIIASIPLTSETTDGGLRNVAFAIGASIRFSIGKAAESPVIAVPPARTDIATTITTYPPTVDVTVTEYDSTEFLPLLNQVFFAEGSDAIPGRYRLLTLEQAQRFDNSDSLLRDGTALDVYYHVLNILGSRMQEYVGTTLNVVGHHNGKERDPRLALRRAEAIRRYLITSWGIAPRRITASGGDLPPNPARESTPAGYEENARVELLASDPNITAPKSRIHTRGIATPSHVVFFPKATAAAGLKRWRIEVVQSDSSPWRVISGPGTPPDSIVWLWTSDNGSMPSYPLQLAYRFTAEDNTGQTTSTDLTPINVNYISTRQQLQHRENDSTVQSYSLLLFNFDRPEVTQSDRELLRAICGNIVSGARVRITGYTDSLGDATYNRKLAAERAEEAAQIIRRLVPPDVEVVVDEADGGEWERFPYSTPEGRSHCRTVFIEVRTPVKREG